nr:GGDEF domain-containing protein [Duganella qianjiadongensis]
MIAQTCMLSAMAAMLWIARTDADRKNGLRTWMFGVSCQSMAYLLLAQGGRDTTLLSPMLGNGLGALSVSLYFVAIRQFVGRPYSKPWLALMVGSIVVVGAVAGQKYQLATIFNSFVYGTLELLNALTLWRASQTESKPVQRTVALAYFLMGIVLPLRACALILSQMNTDYLSAAPVWHQAIFIFGFVYIVVTKLGFVQMCKIKAESMIAQQSLTDGLTGLANRRAFDNALQIALNSAARDGRPFSVVLVDLDHFKALNDCFGHLAGDAALVAFGQRLRTGLRLQDDAFRYGGEEFCVLLPNTDATEAAVVAGRLCAKVALAEQNGHPAQTASFGVAIWRRGDTADTLIGRADDALYRAKSLGRNRVELARYADCDGVHA